MRTLRWLADPDRLLALAVLLWVALVVLASVSVVVATSLT